ncbi:MAG: adenylyl-sulfate kinase [Puniceicoccaceae bacterium]|nr:MAG: adenylyl-sulfate kinase [Puniceicoccaceae bacterium]
MSGNPENIFPVDDRLLDRAARERLLGQRGRVIWFYGLSGSGKTTLAAALERRLHQEGLLTLVLDGDNLRTGLNRGLGFSEEDRRENIRRAAEVSRLLLQAGVVVLCSFITPREELRRILREIIGPERLTEIYVACSFEECARRDVKGLYAKARAGGVDQFTGKDSAFEIPARADLTLDTERRSLEDCLDELYRHVRPLLGRDTASPFDPT